VKRITKSEYQELWMIGLCVWPCVLSLNKEDSRIVPRGNMDRVGISVSWWSNERTSRFRYALGP